jgi:hypothetical protein
MGVAQEDVKSQDNRMDSGQRSDFQLEVKLRKLPAKRPLVSEGVQ